MTVTASQLRAARALLNLTVDQTSARSGVSAFLILQIEAENTREDVIAGMAALATGFETMGIRFLADGDGEDAGAGLRLTRREDGASGLRPDRLNATNDG